MMMMLTEKDFVAFFKINLYWRIIDLQCCVSSAVQQSGSVMLLLFSCSVMSDSLPPCELQNARLPCPPSPPRAFSNSCPLNQWCHPTNFPSVFPFSSCLQSFPASGSLLMSKLFKSGGQRISTLFSIPFPFGHYRVLSRVPWAIQ